MKLFLSSMSVSYEQAPAFSKLVGKSIKDMRLAFITYGIETSTSGQDENIDNLKALGIQVQKLILEDFKDRTRRTPLLPLLRESDVIWLGGGNTYYLRWLLRETRADAMIQGLVSQGKVYGGGSAGAIVAGPTLKYFDEADDPSLAPERIDKGLGLTDIVVVPHWQNEKFGDIVARAADKLEKGGYYIQPLTDEQALIIDGNAKALASWFQLR